MAELQTAKFIRLDREAGPDPKHPQNEIIVKYNPAELTFNKGVQIGDVPIPGLDMPILQFVRGQTETLSLDLFFDSTEDGGMGAKAIPVTIRTDQFYEFVKINRRTHAPPVLRFKWGQRGFPGSNFSGPTSTQNRTNGFQCIAESVRQRFTLFSSEGVPLRATLSVTLREYKSLQDQIQQIRFESSDRTHAHVVQRDDTLSSIAQQVYGDPGRWREIASHNAISDPLDLTPGAILHIPPVS